MSAAILNLTQHPASAEQIEAGVIDLPNRARLSALLTVEELPTKSEIADRCADIAAMAAHSVLPVGCTTRPTKAMIGGAPWMMAALERSLEEYDIEPVYAFSVRDSVEQAQPDGSVRKVNVFRHGGFI